jgi:polysaccharide biosynthesis protein PelF
MIIGLIAEGSYPYITGGVSSWINQLMLNMPEHEFIIISINPDQSRKGRHAYPLPKNLIGMHDIFLDELLHEQGRWNRKMPFTDEETDVLEQLLLCGDVNWTMLFQCFSSPAMQGFNAMDILLSEAFYQLVRKVYSSKYYHMPFTQVYWTLRSMYFNVFALMFQNYPRADIYHAVSAGYAGLIGAFASRVHRGSFILTEHGIYTREREEEIIKADWVKGSFKNMWIDFFYLLSNCAYACSDQVVTLFNYNRNIQIELGCPAEKAAVIHNGIDILKYQHIAELIEQRKDFEQMKVGAIVRVVPIKDIKTMIQAFSLVCKKLDNIKFYIMGPIDEDQEYYDECIQYMNMIKLDRVYFTGKVNIMDYLGDMDLLVLTSISEGQPLAILEGLACKLPFVTTNVGDCGDLINGSFDHLGAAGRVVPVMDYVGIAESIIELCENHDLRRKFGRAGFLRVREKYSFQAFINSYRDIYTRLGKEANQWQVLDSSLEKSLKVN